MNDSARRGGQPVFVLDDVRASFASRGRSLDSVQLTFASAEDMVARLPAGTIVGLAVSSRAAMENPQRLDAILRTIGRAPPTGPAAALVVVGLAGAEGPRAPVAPRDQIHVFVGDVIDGSRRRSATDFDLQATAGEVQIRLRGRNLVTGQGWAIIAIDPRGPLIDAFASDGGQAEWPLRVPGLDVWRVQS